MISTLVALFYWSFWIFPKNRLAAQPLPLGGTSKVCLVLDSAMNRLATMKIC